MCLQTSASQHLVIHFCRVCESRAAANVIWVKNFFWHPQANNNAERVEWKLLLCCFNLHFWFKLPQLFRSFNVRHTRRQSSVMFFLPFARFRSVSFEMEKFYCAATVSEAFGGKVRDATEGCSIIDRRKAKQKQKRDESEMSFGENFSRALREPSRRGLDERNFSLRDIKRPRRGNK